MLLTVPFAILAASIAALDFIFASSIFVILLPVPSASIVLLVNVSVLEVVTKVPPLKVALAPKSIFSKIS